MGGVMSHIQTRMDNPLLTLKAVLSEAAFLRPQTSSSSIWRQHVTVVAALDSAPFVHGSR
jgi:hypothetical protein